MDDYTPNEIAYLGETEFTEVPDQFIADLVNFDVRSK